ncbi:beta-phosphoglucomutase family hydrolase [Kroppenstedtia sanguinis]|uniref:HAD-IA family hydrolase n=1 Tax=Kroppenstedtia sanguinis TaxID=1380684 RepID=UPI003D2069BC
MTVAFSSLEVADLYQMEHFYRVYFHFRRKYTSIDRRSVRLEKGSFQLELTQGDAAHKKGSTQPWVTLEVPDVHQEKYRLETCGLTIQSSDQNPSELEVADPEENRIRIRRGIDPVADPDIQAVIFDLDGTLIDSEPNYFVAEKKLLEEYGIHDFNLEMKKKYIGRSSRTMLEDFIEAYQIRDSVEVLLNKKNRYYIEIAEQQTTVYPEMKRFLQYLRKEDYPVALASGSSPEILDSILSVTGLQDSFDVVLSSETLQRGKPHPDVFLEAAKQLGIPPEHCLVIEDSQYGVEAAKRAFMYCIAIPYLIDSPLSDHFTMADLLFREGMESFTAEKAYRWLQEKKGAAV